MVVCMKVKLSKQVCLIVPLTTSNRMFPWQPQSIGYIFHFYNLLMIACMKVKHEGTCVQWFPWKPETKLFPWQQAKLPQLQLFSPTCIDTKDFYGFHGNHVQK